MTYAYIAGGMTGYPDNNYPAFHAAAHALRKLGYVVTNPADNPEPPCKSWLGYMRMAIPQVARVDAIVMLPGWESSRGAFVEHTLAVGLGLQVLTLDEALERPALRVRAELQTVDHHPV